MKFIATLTPVGLAVSSLFAAPATAQTQPTLYRGRPRRFRLRRQQLGEWHQQSRVGGWKFEPRARRSPTRLPLVWLYAFRCIPPDQPRHAGRTGQRRQRPELARGGRGYVQHCSGRSEWGKLLPRSGSPNAMHWGCLEKREADSASHLARRQQRQGVVDQRPGRSGRVFGERHSRRDVRAGNAFAGSPF